MITVAARLGPSVVILKVHKQLSNHRQEMGGGSGVAITPDGYIAARVAHHMRDNAARADKKPFLLAAGFR